MKRHAQCPGCGVPLPRRLFFKILPHAHYQCETCGCRYMADPLWEWAGDALGAALLGALVVLAWCRVVSWLVATLLSVALVAAAFLLFPYLTRFILVAPAEKARDGSARQVE